MRDIKVTCPSCGFEHPWEAIDIQKQVCIHGRCVNCYTPYQLVLHPNLCLHSYCNIACSGYLSKCKANKIIDFQSRAHKANAAELAHEFFNGQLHHCDKS